MKRKINNILIGLVAISLLVFDIVKACSASFTHDESLSYLWFVNDSFMHIINYYNPVLNNHILNTLLMKFFQWMFGSSELALRMPNILAHGVYMIFVYRLLSKNVSGYSFFFFLLMNANPFLLDFFSLARGYGIAFSLMMIAFYYYCEYMKERKFFQHALALLFLLLAALANFGFINLFLVFILVHNLMEFFIFKNRITLKNIWRFNYLNGLAFLLLLAVVYEPMRKIVQLNLLDTGGMNEGVTGFWEDSVGSLLRVFAYFSANEALIVKIGQAVIILFSAWFILKICICLFRKKPLDQNERMVIFFGSILYTLVGISVLQFVLFKTPFLRDRFALFLDLLFLLMAGFLIMDFYRFVKGYLAGSIMILLSTLASCHTINSLNIIWYYNWLYDIHTKDAVVDVMAARAKEGSKEITLGANWVFDPAINFYKQTWKLNWLNRIDTNAAKIRGAYYYITGPEYSRLKREEIEIVQHYSSVNHFLVKYTGHPRSVNNVYIKTANNKYVCDDEFNGNLIANREEPGAWETFTMIHLENNLCAIRSYRNKCICSDLFDKALSVKILGERIGDWEVFSVIRLGGDTVAFKAGNNKYFRLDEASNRIFADGDRITKDEKFVLVKE